jgi:hypothetical protein
MLLLACALAIVTCGLTANFLFDGNVVINGLFFCSSIIVVNVIFKKIVCMEDTYQKNVCGHFD